MSLPSVNDLAAYLRLDTDEQAAEAALLAQLLDRAKSLLQQLVIVPIAETAITYYDKSNVGVQFREPTVLMFPYRPIGATVAITDSDGVVVDPSTYRVDTQSGMIYANKAVTFPNGPYKLVGTYGLALLENYATLIEPTLSANIIDMAADLYQRRTPGADLERAGDTTVKWDITREVLARVAASVAALRLPVGAT